MSQPAMSAMERSLRRALEAGDAVDPSFRESIYSASERALERMLDGKAMEEAAANAQRARLAETINRIEDEFYERQTAAGLAADGPAQYDPEISLDPAYADAHGYAAHGADHPSNPRPMRPAADEDEEEEEFSLTPVFDGGEQEHPAIAMAASSPGASAVEEPVRPSARARADEAMRDETRQSGRYIRRIVLIGLLALLVIAGLAWFVSGREGSGAATGETSAIELFDGRRLDALSTPNGGRMEALEVADGQQAAVRFTPAGAGSVMAVAMGPGVVSDVGGRPVRIEIVAGSPDGAARSFSVRCLVDGTDRCGEQVFTTARRNESFAFDMTIPEAASAGRFEIAPVPPDGREDLDLFGVRLQSQPS
ncbi:hypothetical protein [Aureimonas psammosilenae]|uniref:hypothetical protein n=1 Tax=Aureimonas psammosilenae TaxID=2495496 RepID=UPI001260D40C|nr:hypothetical protein [Aureimonas psammosilenae]